ncbi:hypothetical protein JYU34_004444 [Plutella xylostella]|uniref:FLYWCH-type domain-containing protein n=1 Tax=Plutella xylostella TaxID=51655 RepID=A0ABQ7QY25_PLUXY|nr:hypothetical protein JYU34_004444 [Plutella xylostella]
MVTTSRGGERLVVGGHSFNRHTPGLRRPRTLWVCGRRSTARCRATVITFEGRLVKTNLRHSHGRDGGRPRWNKYELEDLHFGTSKRGKPMIIFGKHRFNKFSKTLGQKTRWVCYKWSGRDMCRAALLTVGSEIVKINNIHTHD